MPPAAFETAFSQHARRVAVAWQQIEHALLAAGGLIPTEAELAQGEGLLRKTYTKLAKCFSMCSLRRVLQLSASTLISYDGNKLSRQELALVSAPDSSATHKIIPHHEVIGALFETLGFRHIGVHHGEYAVSRDSTFDCPPLSCVCLCLGISTAE